MSRMSRGCLRCRQRRVKCDLGRPACQRCIKRDEVCEGYRDEASIIFRHETSKTISLAASSSSQSSDSPPQRRSRSADRASNRHRSLSVSDPSILAADEVHGIQVPGRMAWLKSPPDQAPESIEQDSVDRFIEKYVIHPCNESSSPGFLEYLPSMFKEVQVVGRHALRWAVQAGAYADLSITEKSEALSQKAFQCYGASLAALSKSLAEPGKMADDYDLMTIVMLDMFETLHVQDLSSRAMHAQGMAQILRLRGHDQIYNPRGWSLFRLAHHRIQKQQLAWKVRFTPAEDSMSWLDQLNDEMSFVKLEKGAVRATEMRERAEILQSILRNGEISIEQLFDVATEMLELDAEVCSWRQSPIWAFRTLQVSELPPFDPAVRPLTKEIELHPDLWMMYEWNYHRAARMLVQEQVLQCVNAALTSPDIVRVDNSTVVSLAALSKQLTGTIRTLAEQVLSTVPQSFGDIDPTGRIHDHSRGPPRCRWIGSYFQLWPIKIVGGQTVSTTADQKSRGKIAFERIREYTGMKSHLGDVSEII